MASELYITQYDVYVVAVRWWFLVIVSSCRTILADFCLRLASTPRLPRPPRLPWAWEGGCKKLDNSPSSASLTTDMLEALEVLPEDFVTPPAAAFIPANSLEAEGNISWGLLYEAARENLILGGRPSLLFPPPLPPAPEVDDPLPVPPSGVSSS